MLCGDAIHPPYLSGNGKHKYFTVCSDCREQIQGELNQIVDFQRHRKESLDFAARELEHKSKRDPMLQQLDRDCINRQAYVFAKKMAIKE